MTRIPLFLTLAAAAALAGCNKESHTIVAGPDTGENDTTNVAANGPIALPPSIIATKIYRCADNNVVTVDYLSDNKSANVHAEKGAPVVQVAAAEAGQPMTAPGGFQVEGSPNSSTAKIAVPGHPSQSCKA
jgi:hypothetical protein